MSESTTTSSSHIESRCLQEVIRLHNFFVDWFTASVPNTEQNFQIFLGSMSPGFQMISPRGVVDDLPDLSASLRRAYGVHGDKRNFKIEIRNCQILFAEDGRYLVRYEEWQKISTTTEEGRVVDDTTARISTVLFREKKSDENETVNGALEWIHVHETWLPDTITTTGPSNTK